MTKTYDISTEKSIFHTRPVRMYFEIRVKRTYNVSSPSLVIRMYIVRTYIMYMQIFTHCTPITQIIYTRSAYIHGVSLATSELPVAGQGRASPPTILSQSYIYYETPAHIYTIYIVYIYIIYNVQRHARVRINLFAQKITIVARSRARGYLSPKSRRV